MNAVVLIPAYQPEDVLKKLTDELLSNDCQVVVVDDGSGRPYQKLFAELEKDCIVLHHDVNKGKGEAIRTGLLYIEEELPDCSVVGVMDADGQHLPEDMLKVLVRALMHPESFVLGCRDVEKMPPRSRFGNTLTRDLFYKRYHLMISDTQTGMRAFSRSFIPDLLTIDGKRYEYEMNVLVWAAEHRIPVEEVRIQTVYRDEKNSTSHFHVIRDSLRIYRKLLLFSLSSLSSFALDYCLFALLVFLFPRTALYLTAANVMARICSGIFNYQMNCRLVFHEKGRAQTAGQYFLLAAGILFLNSIILSLYAGVLRIPVYPAKLLTECTLFVISFLVQSRLIFRKQCRISQKASGKAA